MPAAGRVVEVDADRLSGWVDRFAERHGAVRIQPSTAAVVIAATDGARAEIAIPYGTRSTPASGTDPIGWLADHVRAPRTVGVLIVRRSGWAVGVAESFQLVTSAAGGGHVQGRTKAGGWSQQRYARRRSNQAEQLWQRAANGADSVLQPSRSRLTALFTGGDRGGVAAVLADERLTALAPLVEPRFFSIGDPTRSVLTEVVRRLTAVVITLNELA